MFLLSEANLNTADVGSYVVFVPMAFIGLGLWVTGHRVHRAQHGWWKSPLAGAVTAWMTGAACATRPDLPWVADDAPTGVIERMADVCHGCPVVAACDAFVTTLAGTELDVGGGFWAGKYRNPAPDVPAIQQSASTQLPLPGLTVASSVADVAA